jgi:hypothetical protein
MTLIPIERTELAVSSIEAHVTAPEELYVVEI